MFVDLRNGSGSSTGGGTIELSADLHLRAGAASHKRRFVGSTFNSTVDTLVYVPLREFTETAGPPGVRHTLLMEGSGRVEMVGVWPTTGSVSVSTSVGVHLNGSTAVAAQTKFTPSATLTWFFPAPLRRFAAGDRVHVSVNPGVAPGDVVGTVVLRMDEEAGS